MTVRAALRSRTVIDHAIGIIMSQRHCDSQQAFGVLRGTSQNSNVKLREVAAALVTRTGGRPPHHHGFLPRFRARPAAGVDGAPGWDSAGR